MAHAAAGKHEEAATHLKEAVEHRSGLLPAKHPDVAEALVRLENVLSAIGTTGNSESAAGQVRLGKPTGKRQPRQEPDAQ